MKGKIVFVIIVAVLLSVVGCGFQTVSPTPVGVSGAARDGERYPAEASGAGVGYAPSVSAPAPGLRGEILFPRYTRLGLLPDVAAHIWINGEDIGLLRPGFVSIHTLPPGEHTFSAHIYRRMPNMPSQRREQTTPRRPGDSAYRYRQQHPQQYGAGTGMEDPAQEYVGCARGQFIISPDPPSSQVLSGIFWRLVIPPPQVLC